MQLRSELEEVQSTVDDALARAEAAETAVAPLNVALGILSNEVRTAEREKHGALDAVVKREGAKNRSSLNTMQMQLWKATQARAPPSVAEAAQQALEAERARNEEERARERAQWEADHSDMVTQHAAAMQALESAKLREQELLEGGTGPGVEGRCADPCATVGQMQALHVQQTLALHEELEAKLEDARAAAAGGGGPPLAAVMQKVAARAATLSQGASAAGPLAALLMALRKMAADSNLSTEELCTRTAALFGRTPSLPHASESPSTALQPL
eukprot:4247108-Prymnesium_polylepis.1